MGILPLTFEDGESMKTLGLNGRETFSIAGVADVTPRAKLAVRAQADDGTITTFSVIAQIDTPVEVDYYQHGGILPFVLRQLAT
jgi:aconitate hydratase